MTFEKNTHDEKYPFEKQHNMYDEDQKLTEWQLFKSKFLTMDYLWKKITLLALCRIHDFTRYKVCRSLSDLFYWPDGFCADTVVVILVFVIGLLSLWDDINIWAGLINEFVDDVKSIWRLGIKLMNDDDWRD